MKCENCYGTVAGFLAAKDKVIEELRAQLAELQSLSVTNIMLKVVPGIDGMGEEIYAKSVSEVEALLTEMGREIEDNLALKASDVKAPASVRGLSENELQDLITKHHPKAQKGVKRFEVTDWYRFGKDVQKAMLSASPPAPQSELVEALQDILNNYEGGEKMDSMIRKALTAYEQGKV